MEMTFAEIVASLWSVLDENQEDCEYLSERLNRFLVKMDTANPDDLFELGQFLENGGGAYDRIGYSLVRLAALAGHVEAIEWYESHLGVRLVPENAA